MSNEKHRNWSSTGEHPNDDELLCFIDGEQPSREETEVVEFHLKACWSCRVRAEKLNNVISNFVEFRGQVIKPAIKIPDNRGDFSRRLNRAVAETKAELPLLRRWWSQLAKSFSALNHGAKTLVSSKPGQSSVVSGTPSFNFFNDDRRRRLLVSSGATVILFSVLFTYLFWMPALNPVSAEELLDKTSAARQTRVKSRELPVVYQQLEIRHRNAAGNESLIKAELWQDETYSRVRQTVGAGDDSGENPAGNANSRANELSLNKLQEILRASSFVPAQPFSVPALRGWRKSLSGKRETIEADKEADGNGVLRLKTETTNAVDAGKLLATTLTVRADDYHALEQSFVVKTAEGTEEYAVREMSFAVVSLNSLSLDFFGATPETASVARTSPKPENAAAEPSASPAESPAVQPDSASQTTNLPTVNAAVANPELEVEVLELLHQAGADLGEQVGVAREPNGPVKVSGIVETKERKNQLLNALRPLSKNPAVQINIQTVEEAVAAEQRKKSTNKALPPSVQLETRKVEGVSFPAEAQVRDYFAKQGAGDEAVRDYAARTVNRSAQAMKFLYALKRLKNQIKAEDFGKLSPAARTKLLNLVKSYANSYKVEIAALRRELQPVFGGGASGNSVAINSDADLLAAIDRLFDAGAASSRAVSSALATGGSGGNALRTAEFWKNLANAEAIAERLQSVK